MRYKHIMMAALTLGLGAGLLSAAEAQQVNQKARQKATWYNAPREFQIIDERPTIRDFREAPASAQMMDLPPGPGAGGGAGGGDGPGSMPGGGPTLPAGGLQLGGGGPSYRTPVDPLGALPKSGFGRETNIPARGMAPRGALPSGFTTGVHANLMPSAKTASGPGMAAGNRGAARPAKAATPAATYGGNYRAASSGAGGGGSVSTNVQGVLMNRLKGGH